MREPEEIFVGSWLSSRTAGRAAKWAEAARKAALDMKRGLVGVEGSPFKVITGSDGSFVPQPYPIRVGFWILDRTTGRLITPETMEGRWTLEEGRLPVSVVSLESGDLRIVLSVFASSGVRDGEVVTRARMVVRNDGQQVKDIDGYVTLSPSPLADMVGMGPQAVAWDGESAVLLGGRPFCLIRGGEERGECEMFSWAGVRVLGKGIPEDLLPPADRVAVVRSASVDPGQEARWEVEISSHKFPSSSDYESVRRAVVAGWQTRVPMRLTLPDRRYEDAFYASLHNILLLKTGKELWPGAHNYRAFYLHDGVDMAEALDKAGLHDVVRDCLDVFHFREGDGYLDAIGGCAFVLFNHYRLTHDLAYLGEVYPRMVESCARAQSLRAARRRPEFIGTPLHGLMPPSVSQDNFKMRAHLYLDNWWGVVGLRAAAMAAGALGKQADEKRFLAESEEYQMDILHSIELVMLRDGASSMPAAADYWGAAERVMDTDHRILGAAQRAWAHRPVLCPGAAVGLTVPAELFRASYTEYWSEASRAPAEEGAWFVDYEGVFWGYNVLLARPLVALGMKDVALSNIEWSLRNTSCPGGWCEAMPSRVNADGRRELADGVVIGDVPHGWSAAHYVLLLREMLVQERGDRLDLLPCVPDAWFAAGKFIAMQGAPTYFGALDFRCEAAGSGNEITVDLRIATPPPGGYLLSLPRPGKIARIRVNGETHGDLRLSPGASRVQIEYMRDSAV